MIVQAFRYWERSCEILQKPKKQLKIGTGKLVARFAGMVGRFHRKFIGRRSVSIKGTPANTSHDSESEHPAKVVSRKQSIFAHFRKAEFAKYAREPRLKGRLGQKCTGDTVPRAENFGDLITADHKVLSKGCES